MNVGKTSKLSLKNIKFERVGIHSVDRFISQVEEVLTRFSKLTADIEYERGWLEYYTGFWAYHSEAKL